MFTAHELALALPHEVSLELSDSDINTAWTAAQAYSYDSARWNAYLNRLSLNALLPWLESLGEVQIENDFDQIWEFTNGTRLSIGDRQFIIVPSDTSDIEEFSVPQEWIDIPTLSADYYIAVQVNPDDRYLRVWGFASHAQLKTSGQFNRYTRSYVLERDEVVTDLSALEVSLQLVTDTKVAIAPLPVLSNRDAERLIPQLVQPSLYSPRLDVPFSQWSALIANPAWRQQLYSQRVAQVQPQPKVAVSVMPLVTNLNQWFEDVFEAGWQTIDRLFPVGSPTLALAFRNNRGVASPTSIQRGKVIDLGMQIARHPIALVVTLSSESDQKKGVLIRVYPIGEQVYLPLGIKLILIDEEGNMFRETLPARGNDNFMQLEFTAKPGATFGVRLAVDDVGVTEYFAINQ